MKNFLLLLSVCFVLVACNGKAEVSSINPINWNKRTILLPKSNALVTGKTYLSVYSEIYGLTEHRTQGLTATVSIRNINPNDTIYINKAEYFNTHGELIRTYFSKTVFIKPLETIEIIIDERDKEGGSGANFVFDWSISEGIHDPFFEAVMISTSSQQGISFTTQGLKI
ncbi:DUF3124 domain-containing protein [Bizionia gelidisalsuginis]|uniref:DUF3124 domain-containing protein n=2 Tax=Bizionia TaxID=283785 RepID=A0A8H2LGE1_9FLAO|nr:MULTISPECIES: DUF3124 domain-containing protein [Bizionia]TYB77470.1 DUF3124 domain-containing protein [Bizionia saleffrena]TYC17849.1 DUF3124 domain-containing protein [Bizionia gelidisalsuginis]